MENPIIIRITVRSNMVRAILRAEVTVFQPITKLALLDIRVTVHMTETGIFHLQIASPYHSKYVVSHYLEYLAVSQM